MGSEAIATTIFHHMSTLSNASPQGHYLPHPAHFFHCDRGASAAESNTEPAMHPAWGWAGSTSPGRVAPTTLALGAEAMATILSQQSRRSRDRKPGSSMKNEAAFHLYPATDSPGPPVSTPQCLPVRGEVSPDRPTWRDPEETEA